MLFNSYSFVFLFLPVTVVGYYYLARRRPYQALFYLLAASVTFYSVWNVRFSLLLVGSVAANYWFGRLLLTRPREEATRLLAAAVTANLVVLGYFKYYNFFVKALETGFGASLPALNVVLPVGISFFTFTQIAYLVDCYRAQVDDYGVLKYALFVTYFPHLVAGPIIHHRQVIPQFDRPRAYRFHVDTFCLGATIFIFGLAKKILLADPLADSASVFDAIGEGFSPNQFDAWLGAIGYSLQLYFDFSGYSDMAIGLSLLFNIRLPVNFNSPYKSTSIIDFWRRWHMTLSAFLRDYLYIPLGGNQKGSRRRTINLMITMILGGLWHGAGWTFLMWGTLHGGYLVANHAWRRFQIRHGLQLDGVIWSALSMAITYICVVVGWVFFRASDLTTAWILIFAMFGVSAGTAGGSLHGLAGSSLAMVVAGLLIVWLSPNTLQLTGYAVQEGLVSRWSNGRRIFFGVVSGALLFACLVYMVKPSPFLYFQF